MTVDARILSALRNASGGAVSGTDLSDHLGISRSAIWARIQELRILGYDIEASPHLGYRLLNAPEVLHADDLLSRLGQIQVIGRNIQVFEATTSTMDVAEKLARDGVNEGVVVFAEAQTKGRGRLGRRWVSPPRRGLWFSLLLRPRMRPQSTTQLTVAAATAVARAIERQAGVAPAIKWPNDILVRGKKVGGILTELHAELDQVSYVILGIGVDVNVSASDFPPDVRKRATSLKIETGRPLDRADLAAALLLELDADYVRVCSGRFDAVADEWESRCSTIGKDVVIRIGNRRVEGCAEALDADGALLVRTQHGHLEQVMGGDVTVEQ